MEYNHSRSSIPSYNDKFNIMIIGDDNVGKTSILDKFCNGSFKPTFQSSKEIEYHNKEYSYEGNIFLFKLWDTVSHNKFEKIGLDEIRQKAEEPKFEYYETSALSGYGINEAFNAIFKNVVCGVLRGQ